jgi:hypothetical protein
MGKSGNFLAAHGIPDNHHPVQIVLKRRQPFAVRAETGALALTGDNDGLAIMSNL